jgi:hypothetical protein
MHTLAVNEQKKDMIRRVQTLYDAGNSKTAIPKSLAFLNQRFETISNLSFKSVGIVQRFWPMS